MSCCSDRRAAVTAAPTLRAAPFVAPAAEPPAGGAALRYRGGGALALRGPFSGRVYRVGPAAGAIEADDRDVAALLRTGLFDRVAA